MTSGGHTMTEAWNLQLQGRVRDLEADLAEAERHINGLIGASSTPQAIRNSAAQFLRKMADKLACLAAQAAEIDAFLADPPGEQKEKSI